jgi:hypothetical protein
MIENLKQVQLPFTFLVNIDQNMDNKNIKKISLKKNINKNVQKTILAKKLNYKFFVKELTAVHSLFNAVLQIFVVATNYNLLYFRQVFRHSKKSAWQFRLLISCSIFGTGFQQIRNLNNYANGLAGGTFWKAENIKLEHYYILYCSQSDN